jgi:hypothetical protein
LESKAIPSSTGRLASDDVQEKKSSPWHKKLLSVYGPKKENNDSIQQNLLTEDGHRQDTTDVAAHDEDTPIIDLRQYTGMGEQEWATKHLEAWLEANASRPYPTYEVVNVLAQECDMTASWVSTVLADLGAKSRIGHRSRTGPPLYSTMPAQQIPFAPLHNAAPGPIPEITPLVVRQDQNGVQWITFQYSRDRVKMEYTIRCDVESINVDELLQDFKTENCVYPRAYCPKDQYKGNRLHYETECNTLGWALAQLNPCLRGRRGLIQRAVDTWRDSNPDPRLRTRRVRRIAKMIPSKAQPTSQITFPLKSTTLDLKELSKHDQDTRTQYGHGAPSFFISAPATSQPARLPGVESLDYGAPASQLPRHVQAGRHGNDDVLPQIIEDKSLKTLQLPNKDLSGSGTTGDKKSLPAKQEPVSPPRPGYKVCF